MAAQPSRTKQGDEYSANCFHASLSLPPSPPPLPLSPSPTFPSTPQYDLTNPPCHWDNDPTWHLSSLSLFPPSPSHSISPIPFLPPPHPPSPTTTTQPISPRCPLLLFPNPSLSLPTSYVLLPRAAVSIDTGMMVFQPGCQLIRLGIQMKTQLGMQSGLGINQKNNCLLQIVDAQ